MIIPPKRNAGGKRYGFVRFLNVKDDRLLTTKLETIFLGGRKIFSNIPRFQMKEVSLKQKVSKQKVELGRGR